VGNPHKQKGKDFYSYTVFGIDDLGQFEIFRRYSEFHLFREVLVVRFPGLYIPPIPPKKSSSKNEAEKAWERSHILNLFLKQVVRCPYLFESEEFHLFIRPPQISLEKALTLLPKLNFEENLARITRYFSMSGDVSESQLQFQTNGINLFVGQVRQMNRMLERFKDQVKKFENSFDAQWAFHKQVGEFFGTYEETNLKYYAGEKLENFMLFKHPNKLEAKNFIEELPKTVINPFKVMKLWLKWETLDIAAMMEAVYAKGDLDGKKNAILKKRADKQKELEKLKAGKGGFLTKFKSQNSIVNSITNLTREIQTINREIECYEAYIKVLTLQINHAAIPYFKKDKVSLYNDLINTYSQQYINNSQQISQCFAKIMELNSMINPELIIDDLPSTGVVQKLEQSVPTK
jgi:hypothetical protein